MNRQAVRGILYFLIFFCIGLSLVAIFSHKSPSIKPGAGQKKIVVNCKTDPWPDELTRH